MECNVRNQGLVYVISSLRLSSARNLQWMKDEQLNEKNE